MKPDSVKSLMHRAAPLRGNPLEGCRIDHRVQNEEHVRPRVALHGVEFDEGDAKSSERRYEGHVA